MRIVHLLRHNHNCSLDTSTTVTKLGRHIDVITVRPVIPHIAGIVVGYWRNGYSYRKITREVGLHSNTVYDIIKRFRERENFACGRRTRRPRKSTQINCKGQTCATLLGPETHQSTTRPMTTCHLLRRKSIHALPDRQSDPCSKTGWRSHEWRLYKW